MLRLIFILGALAMPADVSLAAHDGLPDRAPDVEGWALVIDGDTLEIDGRRIHLWGVEAPKLAGRDGLYARATLDEIIFTSGPVVSCWRAGPDTDEGRLVARCAVGDDHPLDLGAAMVRAGWAWPHRIYARTFYDDAEIVARKACRGLWAGLADSRVFGCD